MRQRVWDRGFPDREEGAISRSPFYLYIYFGNTFYNLESSSKLAGRYRLSIGFLFSYLTHINHFVYLLNIINFVITNG